MVCIPRHAVSIWRASTAVPLPPLPPPLSNSRSPRVYGRSPHPNRARTVRFSCKYTRTLVPDELVAQ
jgi:hypothetical protein